VAFASADAGRSARATRAKEGSHGEASYEAIINAIVNAIIDDCEVAT
jgi:hypothetical protein